MSHCSVDGCDRPILNRARRLCRRHYRRFQRHGEPTAGAAYRGPTSRQDYKRTDVAERLWAKVDKTPAGCWIWTGATAKGYGVISVYVDGRPRNMAAHRVAYQLVVGPIPEGFDLDHVFGRGCRSRACVNPDHLEPVTRSENMLRAFRRV